MMILKKEAEKIVLKYSWLFGGIAGILFGSLLLFLYLNWSKIGELLLFGIVFVGCGILTLILRQNAYPPVL